MSTSDSRHSGFGASRTWIALTVAGWLTVIGLALPSAISTDAPSSPTLEFEATPVKAYPG